MKTILYFCICCVFTTSICGQSITDDIHFLLEKIDGNIHEKKWDKALALCLTINDEQSALSPKQKVKFNLYKTQIHKEKTQYKKAELTITAGIKIYELDHLEKDSTFIRLLLYKSFIANSLGKSQVATEALQECIRIGEKILPKNHKLKSLSYNELADMLTQQGKFVEAVDLYQKAIDLFKELYKTEEHYDIATTYSNLAKIYSQTGEYKKAEMLFKKSLQMYRTTLGEDDLMTIKSAYSSAKFHFVQKKDFGKAIELLNYASKIAQKNYNKEPLLGYIYNLLAGVYTELENFELADEFLRKAAPIYESNSESLPIQLFYFWTSYGFNYSRKGDAKTAIKYFHKAEKQIKSVEGDYPFMLANIYDMLGVEYSDIKSYEKAEKYLLEATSIIKNISGDHDPDLAYYYSDLADNYSKKGQIKLAIQTIDKSILASNFSSKREHLFSEIIDHSILLRAFTDKLRFLLDQYNLDPNETLLAQANDQSNLTLNLVQFIREQYNNTTSIIEVSSEYKEVFEVALKIKYKLYKHNPTTDNLQACLNTIESHKSYLFLAQILTAKAKAVGNIPAEIIEKEKTIKSKKSDLEEQILYGENEDDILKWSNELLRTNESLDSLITFMKSNYPEYTNFKYNLQQISISEIQKTLSKDQTFIEFFVGEFDIFIIKISDNTAEIIKINKNFPLNKWIQAVQNSIQKPFLTEVDAKTYLQYKSTYEKYAFLLYEKLILPIGDINKEVMIIPDESLWNLPFGCLLTEKENGNFKSKPYFIKNHDVFYNFSMQTYQLLDKKKIKSKGWLGIAPEFEETEKFNPLYFNNQEVTAISKLVGGTQIIKKDATKKHFLAQYNQFSVLHFATHTVIDPNFPENSYLAFSSDSLHQNLSVRDIYQHQFPMEMVVLSACNSGKGYFQAGEGMASIGRAFFYAGTKSTILTQWQVNDKVTSEILTDFYKNLQKEQKKSLALGNAARKYLQSQKEQRFSHPFYWAGFMSLGSIEPIMIKSNQSIVFWIIGGFSCLLFFYFIKKKS